MVVPAQASIDGEIPYARLDGRVEPTEQPIHTVKEGETAVVKITENYRVKRNRAQGENRYVVGV